MTDKQIDRVRKKIEKYKKALKADKKYWGGYYHDGAGIRYAIPKLFIKIIDYKGGLKYLNWVDKNFPDDIGDPIFLFEWTFILFKCGKLKEAEEKAHRTFFSNTYLWDIFLGKKLLNLDITESSSWEFQSIGNYFTYTSSDTEFIEFTSWIQGVLNNRRFLETVNEFVQIEQQLKTEPVGQIRSELVAKYSKIKYG